MTPSEIEVQTPTPSFMLWHRRGRRPWQAVATAAAESELTAQFLKLPTGEAVALRSGEHPNDRWKRNAQRAKGN